MFVKWLADELERRADTNGVTLLIDPNKEYEFALSDLEIELELDYPLVISDHPFKSKYLVEKKHPNEPCIVYVPIAKEELDYLAEYEATGETFVTPLHEFIREKTGLDELDERWLKVAARASIGKDTEYWDNIKIKGKEGILGDFDRRALHFLTDSEETANALRQQDMLELFESATRETYGIDAPPGNVKALEDQLSRAVLLSGLSKQVLETEMGDFTEKEAKELKKLYNQWMDSAAGRESFEKHVAEVEDDLNWDEIFSEIVSKELDPDHPFPQADISIQEDYLNQTLAKEEDLGLEQKEFIYKRGKSQAVQSLDLPNWKVFSLLVKYFDERNDDLYSTINSIDDFLDAYDSNLWRLDSIRRLSFTSLSNDDLKEKVEKLYEREWDKLDELWYEVLEESDGLASYRGTTVRELVKDKDKTAVILADGFRYELAKQLQERLEDFTVELGPTLTALPTKTSVGMGMLSSSGEFSVDKDFYVNDIETNSTISDTKDRIDNLTKLLQVDVTEQKITDSLGKLGEGITVFYYRDIDEMGEASGRNALTYFSDVVDKLTATVNRLLGGGYSTVILLSDHGFIFNEPEESAKITSEKLGPRYSEDRFAVGSHLNEIDGTVTLSPDYLEEEIAVPKGRNVFKSPSTYEFMHGGASPQELIIPKLEVKKSAAEVSEKPDALIDEDEPKKVQNKVFDLTVKLVVKDQTLFEKKRKIKLQVTKSGEKLFTSSVIGLSTESGVEETKVEVNLPEGSKEGTYKAFLVDGKTGEQLDSCDLSYEPLRKDLGL